MSEIEKLAKIRKDITAKMTQLKKEAQKIGEKYLKESAKRLFDKYPDLKSFAWNQYTPYFNDGDPCTFSADTYGESLYINGINMDDWYDGEYDGECEGMPSRYLLEEELQTAGLTEERIAELNAQLEKVQALGKDRKLISEEVETLLSALEEEDFEAMFGNNVTVTVTKKKIETGYYSPDY